MENLVPLRRPRLFGRCPACGRRLALLPAGWVRTCLHYVLLRARRYRCRFCGHEEVHFPVPPQATR